MADFEIPEEPEYNRNIRRFETTDPAHADLFNAVAQTLINNDEFLKRTVEQQKETVLEKTGDAGDTTVTFTSGDTENPEDWTEITPVESGEKQSSLWRKVSLFAKNLRYLWKLCGTSDISGVGDGTLTGAVSKLNTDLIGKSPIKIGTSETSFCNAAGGAGITSVFATLDKIHREISSTENGFHNTTAVGPIYGILLQKTDSSGQSYSGIAFSYATMAIVYFAYVGGTFYIKVYG